MTFKAGETGNPNGRPQGSGHRQKLFAAIIEPHKDALFQTAINLALSGNETMLRLFLERMLPKPGDNVAIVNLAGANVKKTDGLLSYGENILKAIAEGELTPDQAKTIMGALDLQRRQIESSELADRVSSIESVLKARKQEK